VNQIPKWSASAPLEQPYRRAKQEWDDRIGSAIVQARTWRYAAAALLVLLGFAVAGLVYLGRQPKVVPHVIEINELGAASYRGAAGRQGDDFTPSQVHLKYHLRRFIEATRSVSTDPAVIKRNWLEAYAMASSAGANMLTEYVRLHDPFKRGATERVTVEVLAMVPVTSETWQADWEEAVWDDQGAKLGASRWRGMFRVVRRQPESEEQLTKNPLGLFVDEIHWDRIGN
jgi:type IV secretory pathway TrbF-like protein